jgi:hypothetical protein
MRPINRIHQDRHIRRIPLAASLALVLAACVSTRSDESVSKPKTEWLEPSSHLAKQIEDQAQRLPWIHGVEERITLIQWFASVGEPAYPTLLELVLDPRPDVAGAALASLGATRDQRLVEPLRKLPWPTLENEDLALERARTLLFLGDWSMAEHLILGLRDPRTFTRALCIQALAEVTHERFGFDSAGEAEDREAAVQRGESWWQSRSSDPFLAAQ